MPQGTRTYGNQLVKLPKKKKKKKKNLLKVVILS